MSQPCSGGANEKGCWRSDERLMEDGDFLECQFSHGSTESRPAEFEA